MIGIAIKIVIGIGGIGGSIGLVKFGRFKSGIIGIAATIVIEMILHFLPIEFNF